MSLLTSEGDSSWALLRNWQPGDAHRLLKLVLQFRWGSGERDGVGQEEERIAVVVSRQLFLQQQQVCALLLEAFLLTVSSPPLSSPPSHPPFPPRRLFLQQQWKRAEGINDDRIRFELGTLTSQPVSQADGNQLKLESRVGAHLLYPKSEY